MRKFSVFRGRHSHKLLDFSTEIIEIAKAASVGARGGHGGGDEKFSLDFLDYLNGNAPSVSCATLEGSAISPLTVFAAEKARKSGKVIEIDA